MLLQWLKSVLEEKRMTKINYNEKGDIKMKNATYYENRELSWLKFNERVLNEAGNPEVPLAQRLSFAAIYQSNLDEFYMVRVGSLTDRQKINKDEKENKTGMTPKEQINAILKRTKELEVKKARIYEQLMGELEPQGIRLINFNKLSKEEGDRLEKYFNNYNFEVIYAGTTLSSKYMNELLDYLRDKETREAVWFIKPYDGEIEDNSIVFSDQVRQSPYWQRNIYDTNFKNTKLNELFQTFRESNIFYATDLCGTDFKQVIDFTIRR